MLQRFRQAQPRVKALQAEVDTYMAQFEDKEAEEERRRKEEAGKVRLVHWFWRLQVARHSSNRGLLDASQVELIFVEC
jgi:multidrug resistance efflux pump